MPKSDIVDQGYDLSINHYKEVVYEKIDHRPPQAILDELDGIEKEITEGMQQLPRLDQVKFKSTSTSDRKSLGGGG